MKKFSSITQQKGELGEDLAVRYLEDKGFKILERNHTKKWGEIDIVAKKSKITHFVEVKSVSSAFTVGDSEGDGLDPEDHMHFQKQARLKRIIRTYMESQRVNQWQFDLLCVFIDEGNKKAKIRPYYDIILDPD